MTPSEQPRDAIIFVPGISGGELDLGLDDAARRQAVALDSLQPANVLFPTEAAGERRLGLLERLRKSRYLHVQYWGASSQARSFLEEIVPRIWGGTANLA